MDRTTRRRFAAFAVEVRYLAVNVLIGLLVASAVFSIEIYLGDYVEGNTPARDLLLPTLVVQLAFAFIPLVVALVIILISLRWLRLRRVSTVAVLLGLGLLAFLVLLSTGNPRFGALCVPASVVFGIAVRLPSQSGGGPSALRG